MFWDIIILLTAVLVKQAVALEPTGRIVNGSNADIKDFPFMVSVRVVVVHTCGGTILDEYNVLTAAHCVSQFPPELYFVEYGTANITGGNYIEVENYMVHEEFVYTEAFNDIAIIHLSSPLPLGNGVQPVTLSSDHSPTPENADAVLIGWGLDKTNGTSQSVLQRVDIKVYPDEECQHIYNSTNSSYQLCAGVQEGGKGQCEGDSGGPLLVDGVEVGIVSWSHKPCTGKGYPGVFTKVSSYVEWIKNHMKKPNNSTM